MPLYLSLTAYLTATAMVSTGTIVGLTLLKSPSEAAASKAETPKLVRRADRDKLAALELPSSQSFRYGPEVNHGRSDTPINAAAQARKEAQAGKKKAHSRIIVRPLGYSHGATNMMMHPSDRSTGH
jgi:hypothetical protein